MKGVSDAHDVVLILDFGSQYTHLIARRLRECSVYCELLPHDVSAEDVARRQPKGIVLSGGPFSVYEEDAPHVDPKLLELDVPVLGICYGLQEMVRALGGRVEGGATREFGHATLRVNEQVRMLDDIDDGATVWMSHGDKVVELPSGFVCAASTDGAEYSMVVDENKKLYGVQFHPEVTHTPRGTQMGKDMFQYLTKCRSELPTNAVLTSKFRFFDEAQL